MEERRERKENALHNSTHVIRTSPSSSPSLNCTSLIRLRRIYGPVSKLFSFSLSAVMVLVIGSRDHWIMCHYG